jgi:hypothetical protein
MKSIITSIGYLLLLSLSIELYGQELNCTVSINSSKIQGTNKDIFNTLRNSITEFMNSTVWTSNVFEVNERIECNLIITLDNYQSDIFSGNIQMQARRPVYGSSFNSLMLNFVDNDIQFKYIEFDPLEFSENTNLSNLTSLLAYYSYVIIGLDYDSFSLKGGTPYFQKAEHIVNNCQNAGESGWKAFESRARRNRYWLVNNILSEQYAPLRTFNYNYHRLGLDVMDQSVEKGRGVIKNAIMEMDKFYQSKPDPYMFYFQTVLESKAEEIVQVFSQALPEEKRQVFEIMTRVDPANPAKYASLKQ